MGLSGTVSEVLFPVQEFERDGDEEPYRIRPVEEMNLAIVGCGYRHGLNGSVSSIRFTDGSIDPGACFLYDFELLVWQFAILHSETPAEPSEDDYWSAHEWVDFNVIGHLINVPVDIRPIIIYKNSIDESPNDWRDCIASG